MGTPLSLLLQSTRIVRQSVRRTAAPATNAIRNAMRRGGEQGEGADVHTPVLSALGPLHRAKALPPVSAFGGERRDAGFDAERSARCSAVLDGRAEADLPFAGLKGVGIYRESRSGAGHQHQRRIFTLDLTNPAAKPAKVSTSAGWQLQPRLLAGREVSRMAIAGTGRL